MPRVPGLTAQKTKSPSKFSRVPTDFWRVPMNEVVDTRKKKKRALTSRVEHFIHRTLLLVRYVHTALVTWSLLPNYRTRGNQGTVDQGAQLHM